jgi:hypothetical protein
MGAVWPRSKPPSGARSTDAVKPVVWLSFMVMKSITTFHLSSRISGRRPALGYIRYFLRAVLA